MSPFFTQLILHFSTLSPPQVLFI